MPGLVLDQHNHSTSTGGTTTTISVTTGAANTLVVVATVAGSNSTTTAPTLSIAGAGLTWNAIDMAHSATGILGGGVYVANQLWWAIAAVQLTSQLVTITSSLTVDDCCNIYASFTGGYNAAPVDPNAGAVVASLHNGTAAAASGNLSSTNADDVAVIIQGSNTNNSMTVTPPVTMIEATNNAGGARFASLCMAYRSFTTPQNNTAVGFTATNSFWGYIGCMFTADATQAAQAQARVMVMA